jgi:hypothetical protein
MNAEFTIHQNTIYNAVVYGFLCDKKLDSYLPNQRPVFNTMTVKKINPETTSDNLIIEATVSDPDAGDRIYKVEFFDSWHKIGEAFEAPYKINWTCSGTRDFDITAKVYDKLGAMAKSVSLKRASIITALQTPERKNPRLNVFPNPSSGQINFQLQDAQNQSVKLSIFNVDGKLVKSIESPEEPENSRLFTWNPEKQNCPEGMYLYSMIISSGKNNLQEKGKFVYQKN